MINIGVIGYGYWGPNMVRNFSEISESRVTMVSDLNPERLNRIKEKYPSVQVTQDCRELIRSSAVDAVVIATPVGTHFDIAFEVLRAGKPVLVEKPMTTTVEQGQKLLEEAAGRNLVLLVDHTFVYMGAVKKIKELIQTGELGHVYYYDSTRVNLGLFQYDVNVIHDLAVHDLSIMDYVLGGIYPTAVSANGKSHVPGKPENTAYVTLFFESDFIAHINVNWLSPVKLRQTLIGGSNKMIFFDDIAATEKIKIYDAGITVNGNAENMYEAMVSYRMGDICVPQFDRTEALRVEALHFLDCIEGKTKPLTGPEMGLRVVKILEAASQSLHQEGKRIELSW